VADDIWQELLVYDTHKSIFIKIILSLRIIDEGKTLQCAEDASHILDLLDRLMIVLKLPVRR
jgi:hypothetical protein